MQEGLKYSLWTSSSISTNMQRFKDASRIGSLPLMDAFLHMIRGKETRNISFFLSTLSVRKNFSIIPTLSVSFIYDSSLWNWHILKTSSQTKYKARFSLHCLRVKVLFYPGDKSRIALTLGFWVISFALCVYLRG